VANSLTNLAGAQLVNGDHGGARRGLLRAQAILDKTVGPNNPQSTRVLVSLGRIDLHEGAIQRGHDRCEQALAILEPLVGAEHDQLLAPLTCLGWAELELGQATRALPLLERAHAMRDLSPPDDAALTRVLLARALDETEGDPQRAKRLRKHARASLAKHGGTVPERIASWLQEPS